MLYPDTEDNIFTDDFIENKRRIESYWDYIKSIFEEVKEYSTMEIIRNQKEREKYVTCTYSKVVGITGSYAM